MMDKVFIYLSIIGILYLVNCNAQSEYRIGMGIWDVTGPPAEVNMMGMGQAGQRTSGLHFRLRSRATIIEDINTSKRIVYVTNNLCMTYGSMMQNITSLLQAKYGSLYGYENIMVSGEHTHSGPAGFSMFFIFYFFLFFIYFYFYSLYVII